MHNISSLEGFPEVDHRLYVDRALEASYYHFDAWLIHLYVYSSLPRFFDEAWSTTSVDHSLIPDVRNKEYKSKKS